MSKKIIDWDACFASGRDYQIVSNRELDGIIQGMIPGDSLDLGCGSGQLVRELYHRGFNPVGVDKSAEAIMLAKKTTVREGIEFFEGDAANLASIEQLAGREFGLITCKHMIAFIDNHGAFLQQIKPYLALDGRLVIITPITTEAPAEQQAKAIDPAQFDKDVKSAGFKVSSKFSSRNATYYLLANTATP